MSAKRMILLAAMSALAGAALADEKSDPCGTGLPWILPPTKQTAKGEDYGEQHVVRNTAAPVRVTVCNCSGKKQADSYVILNAYRAEGTKVAANRQRKPQKRLSGDEKADLPNSNTVTRVYSGACVDAGGTDILIRNLSLENSANGTYSVAK